MKEREGRGRGRGEKERGGWDFENLGERGVRQEDVKGHGGRERE